MKVSVAYATPARQFWMTLDLPDGAKVKDAIDRSGVLNQFPDIDLGRQKVGVFSKITALDAALENGDRVEIYRPLTADPKKVKQRGKSEGDAPKTEH
jgi:putative ubiquitin-RnfH superfamily antitoxin RatB of RatAB toxin-antitoxin module